MVLQSRRTARRDCNTAGMQIWLRATTRFARKFRRASRLRQRHHAGALGTTSLPPSKHDPNTSSQIFCCKSIDKLISDSEDADRRLNQDAGSPLTHRPRHRCRDRLGYLHRRRHRHRRSEVRHLVHPERTAARLHHQAHRNHWSARGGPRPCVVAGPGGHRVRVSPRSAMPNLPR